MRRRRSATPATAPLLQVHIPKTAGTSVRVALLPEVEATRHFTADQIPRADWENCYLFTFVRDPFSRAVSMWRYHTNDRYRGVLRKRHPDLGSLDFLAYLRRFVVPQQSPLFAPQVAYLHHPESPKPVDFIGRFENLDEDFRRLASLRGVDVELPHRLVLPRADHRDFYEPESLAIVRSVFARDFDELGYSTDLAGDDGRADHP